MTKYTKVVDFVTEKILSGEWKPGHKLPSQAEWRSLHGVTYGTLRGAYLTLKAKGLITGQQGEGVYVTPPGGATDEDIKIFDHKYPGVTDV